MKNTSKQFRQRNRPIDPAKRGYLKSTKAVTVDETTDLESRRISRGAIAVFIIFHLVAITVWSMPLDYGFLVDARELVRPYMLWTGLFQSWDTFAPEPKAVNSFAKAAVITKDHHMHVYLFPRMEELGFGRRYQEERYRKFVENFLLPKNAALWPDIASHIAKSYDDPLDPPEKVVLIQFQSDIKPGAPQMDVPDPRPTVFYDEYVDTDGL